ncbi:MAG: hypothetical protein WA921_09495, partial [Ahrensia sp.]
CSVNSSSFDGHGFDPWLGRHSPVMDRQCPPLRRLNPPKTRVAQTTPRNKHRVARNAEIETKEAISRATSNIKQLHISIMVCLCSISVLFSSPHLPLSENDALYGKWPKR